MQFHLTFVIKKKDRGNNIYIIYMSSHHIKISFKALQFFVCVSVVSYVVLCPPKHPHTPPTPTHLWGGGHIFGADPVGGVNVGVGIGGHIFFADPVGGVNVGIRITLSFLHNRLLTSGWIPTEFSWINNWDITKN